MQGGLARVVTVYTPEDSNFLGWNRIYWHIGADAHLHGVMFRKTGFFNSIAVRTSNHDNQHVLFCLKISACGARNVCANCLVFYWIRSCSKHFFDVGRSEVFTVVAVERCASGLRSRVVRLVVTGFSVEVSVCGVSGCVVRLGSVLFWEVGSHPLDSEK